jgi:SM-20-related protein
MQKHLAQQASIISQLSESGYAICDAYLPAKTITALANKAKQRFATGAMAAARTGQQAENAKIRGDSIFWLSESSTNTSVQAYFSKMHVLRNALNLHLFMNVQELETHLAVYPIGSVYEKHLDQFSNGEGVQARQLSSILYLNNQWLVADGGTLRLHLNAHKYLDIAPTAGKLVLFLSSQFWHEVLPATRDRISLTGWFRTR